MINIIELYTDYNIPYWTQGKNTAPGWVQTRCPFCSDSSNHLGFNIARGYFYCWKCGAKRVKEVFTKLLDRTYQDIDKLLFEYSGETFVVQKRKNKNVTSIHLPGESLKDNHKRYLKKRNFDPDHIEQKYKIRGTGITGDWRFRIIIPIFFKNKLVSFQGRDITDKQKLRYKALSDEKSILSPKKVLYNLENCLSNSIIVLEGITDVWRFGDNSCCTFGTSLTEEQIFLLSLFDNIFFIFDDEEEAQQKALKSAKKLSAIGCDVEIIDLENDKDPAELSDEESNKIKKELL